MSDEFERRAKEIAKSLQYVVDPDATHRHPDFIRLVEAGLASNEKVIEAALKDFYRAGHRDGRRYEREVK